MDFKVFENLKSKIITWHESFCFPVKAEILEEMICRVLQENKVNFSWKKASHKSCTDITAAGKNFSMKSGKDEKGIISISSSRTTKSIRLADKIIQINKSLDECDYIFLCCRSEAYDDLSYSTYIIPSKLFKLDTVEFVSGSTGHTGKNEYFNCSIVNNMSDQLWYYFNKEKLEEFKLFKADFKKKIYINGLEDIRFVA